MRIALLGAAAAAIFGATLQGQSILGPPSEANHFIETPKGWVHPKTPWGEPDIQANLNMMQAAGIPLERCANAVRFGGPPCDMNKAWWTEEEHKQRIAAAAGRGDLGRQLIEKGEFGRALLSGVTDPSTPQRQTTLIVDPLNGLLPALTPEGKRRALEMRSGWSLPGESPAYDSVTDFDSWDRCITRGMPSSMMPYRYNGGFRILQAPGYVVFRLEMIHEARIVPTDGREPPPDEIEQWLGVSRGRWEGTTLVVETTRYAQGPPLINLAVVGSPPGNRFPYSEQMKTTERIVRLNDDTWLYEITTEERKLIDEVKEEPPMYRHRKIQGVLQQRAVYLSASAIYEHLKATGRVEPYERRPAPWQSPHYEVWQKNLMWGSDWPVVLLEATYEQAYQTMRKALGPLHYDDEVKLFRTTTMAFYGVTVA